jgi:hypothetical protein
MTHAISNSEIERLGNDLDLEEEKSFQSMVGVATTCINKKAVDGRYQRCFLS